MKDGKAKLDTIHKNITDAVTSTLTQARNEIRKAGVEIAKGSDNIKEVIDDLKQKINDNTTPVLDTADDYIKQYAPYRYYVGLAVSCILLLVSVFVALGLVCGICGKRPDGYGDDCCNKGAGSQFLVW